MKIKKYSDFINETIIDPKDAERGINKMDTIRALFLISKTGEVVEKSGYIILGNGIMDDDKKSWVAAIGEDMKLYSNINDNNPLFTVVNNDKYNPETSPNWKDSNGEGI
jgi:hypothetical protein